MFVIDRKRSRAKPPMARGNATWLNQHVSQKPALRVLQPEGAGASQL